MEGIPRGMADHRGEIGHGILRGEHEGVVVCGARAELSDVGEFAAVQRLRVFQDVEHRGVLGCEARSEHALVSEDEIVCGDRITVGPFGVTPEVKRPREPVRRVRPPLGHGGHGRGVPGVVLGETLEERDAGRETEILTTQLRGSLAGVPAEKISSIVVAYEPVWAIGTGVTATAAQAQEAHAFVRSVVTELYGSEIAQKLRIQYGGSVKPNNAAELMACPDIDGALIGGASLEAQSFVDIIVNGCPVD